MILYIIIILCMKEFLFKYLKGITMKAFKAVEKNRVNYHEFANKRTVHRSSLLAPKLDGAETWISFLNHFLIKRNYKKVVCKVTAIDINGNDIDSSSLTIEKPIVYNINLDKLFDKIQYISEFMIEFFSENNLFIPFPAVIVNHVGDGFVNSVHSFNRVLNDTFENETINSNHVNEASIDVVIDNNFDTFFNFVSGPNALPDKIEVSLKTENKSLVKEIMIDQKKLTNKNYYVSEIFPDSLNSNEIYYNAILSISQPKQQMFYGRLLSGIIEKKTKAFSANHSYYDSSTTEEYFDNSISQRTYPFFKDYFNGVSFYPIMSPSELNIHIEYSLNGSKIKSKSWPLKSPGNKPLNLNINEIIGEKNKEFVSAFNVVATSSNKKIPTRVNHQIQYSRDQESKLKSSVNTSLLNSAVFVPEGKTGMAWGQIMIKPNYTSNLGICFVSMEGDKDDVEVEIYSDEGKLINLKKQLNPGESILIDEKYLNPKSLKNTFLWFVARSKRPDLAAQSFHTHLQTGHTSGEHNF